MVNAYEDHAEIYDDLEQKGGTVLIRGRGIVASRVIQRIYEARAKNPNIRILHLNRSAIDGRREVRPVTARGSGRRSAAAVQLAEVVLGRNAAQASRAGIAR